MTDDMSPLDLFLSLLRSSESKRQYPRRLQVFFNFLGLEGDIEKQSQAFVTRFRKDNDNDRYLQKKLLAFSSSQKERVDNKEISPSTVPNYFKAIKLFTQANNISNKVEWKLVTKSLPLGFKASDDRPLHLKKFKNFLISW